MDAKTILSGNIAKYRKRYGMTQSQLAAQMGVSTQAVSKWEQGICAPDITLLPDLASVFEITINELFSE